MKKLSNRAGLSRLLKRFLLIIKLTLTLLLLCLVPVTASTYSQNTRLDISLKDGKMADLIKQIEEKSEFFFYYQNEDLRNMNEITVELNHATVMDILDLALQGSKLNYRIVDKYVILRRSGDSFGEDLLASARESAVIQQRTVSGKVTDSGGQLLPGVTIVVKGTTHGAATNPEGEYALTNVPEDATLVFSFVGMQTLEVLVNNRTIIDVVMKEDVIGLEEVVAIGYGTQKKINVIGSIATVSNEDITAAPVSNVANSLAGRLPGGVFMQTSGEPGNDAATIRIRGNSTLGSNSPLIVIDGIAGRDLNSINPNDIESLTILKDASAGIYGARAANGVILITTKKGNYEMPLTFTYNFNEGRLSPVKLPKMADAATYAKMLNEMQSYRGVPETDRLYSLEDVAKFESGEYPWTHPNSNWPEMALKDYSSSRQHNLSATGGTSNVGYFVSFGTQFDDGIFTNNNTSFNRYNIKGKFDIKLHKLLKIGVDIHGVQENRMYAARSRYATWGYVTRMPPTYPALWPNGLPGPDREYGDQPMVTGSDETGFDDDKRYRSNNIFSAEFIIPGIEGLILSGYYSYDLYFQERKLFYKPWILYHFNEDAYLEAGNTGKEDGSEFLFPVQKGPAEPNLTQYSTESKSKTANIKLDYSNTFGKAHNVNAFISYEQYEYYTESFQAYRRYFESDKLPYLFAGGDDQKDNTGSAGIDARQNYFGRITYDYNQIYLFQFSFRRDGSLRFSKDAGRWGNFPSFLLGWRPSEYEWWKDNISFIDYFKLKASYGQMGNDAITAFQYMINYGFTTGAILGDNKGYYTGLRQTSFPNPFITWEIANIYNFGWESSLWNEKIVFDADLFYERRSNILVERDVSVPRFTGISLPDENYGIVDNRGFEILLGYKDKKGDLSYDFSGNFAFARNEIVEIDEPERSVPWQRFTGQPMGSSLLYKKIGIFRDEEHVNSYPHVINARPGDIIIEDFDEDGKITSDDRQIFPHTTTPEITYGFSFNLRYENWKLSGLIQGQGKTLRYIYTNSWQGTNGNYYQWDADDRWTPENIDATKPRAYEWEEEYWRGSHITDHHYANCSFARLKNLQLSYSLTSLIESVSFIKEASLNLSGQNLWLIYTGNQIMDPETNGQGAYPIMKIIALGAKISF